MSFWLLQHDKPTMPPIKTYNSLLRPAHLRLTTAHSSSVASSHENTDAPLVRPACPFSVRLGREKALTPSSARHSSMLRAGAATSWRSGRAPSERLAWMRHCPVARGLPGSGTRVSAHNVPSERPSRKQERRR